MPMMTFMVIEMIALGMIALWVNLYTLWPDVQRVSVWVFQVLTRSTRVATQPVRQHAYHYGSRRH